MENRRCAGCRRRFIPRPQRPNQRFCSAEACQRERRRRWQREKRRTDPDYQENQARAQQRWAERHRDYWRGYRARHAEYTARNRAQQRERDRRRAHRRTGGGEAGAGEGLAKSDAWGGISPVPSGTYELVPVTGPDVGLAKMNAWRVELRSLSMG